MNLKKLLLLSLCVLFVFSGCSSKGETTDASGDTEGEKKHYSELVDFVVDIESGKEPVILQLTDPQIIDSTQNDRLGEDQKEYYLPKNMDKLAFDYLDEIITQTKPDFILLTGDIVFGEFDHDGSCFKKVVDFMESYKIPWAPVMGNHDPEADIGVDWQCEQLENAEYCLFKQRDLTGNGNYTVGVARDDKLLRVFYMMDTNGCSLMSEASRDNGHTQSSAGLAQDQRFWFIDSATVLKESYPDVKISVGMHIPPAVFTNANLKYGAEVGKYASFFVENHKNYQEGDTGYVYSVSVEWDGADNVWNEFKSVGVDSIFVGHLHSSSSSIVYDGVRLQFGQKSSAYDCVNWVTKDKKIVFEYGSEDSGYTPIVGGTVMTLTDDGTINTPEIYYCENAGGQFDFSKFK